MNLTLYAELRAFLTIVNTGYGQYGVMPADQGIVGGGIGHILMRSIQLTAFQPQRA